MQRVIETMVTLIISNSDFETSPVSDNKNNTVEGNNRLLIYTFDTQRRSYAVLTLAVNEYQGRSSTI